MATIRIPEANWPHKLHTALSHLGDGDTLIVSRETVRAAAKSAIAQRCPDVLAFVEVAREGGVSVPAVSPGLAVGSPRQE